MLGCDKEQSDDVWFRTRIAAALSRDGPIHYEQNQFTAEYLGALRRVVESSESRLQDETTRLRTASEFLTQQIALKTTALGQLGMAVDPDAVLLATLSVLLEADGPSLPRIIKGMDEWERRLRVSTKGLEQVESLARETAQLSCEVAELREKMTQSERSFGGWVKRDILMGIEELRNATHTVQCKREEYEERLRHLHSQDPPLPSGSPAASLVDKLELIRQRREELAQVQEALRPYNQLPPDLTLATIEVERARQQLDALLAQRDQLLRRFRH